MRPGPRLLLCLLGSFLGVRAAFPQAIQGTLLEATTDAPIQGALVVLLHADGTPHSRLLSDASGKFVLPARGPGRYTVLAERVGFQAARSAAVELTGNETKALRLSMSPHALALEALSVDAKSRRCTVRPGTGLQTADLWEEARKALNTAAFAQERKTYMYSISRFRRELDPRSRRVQREEMHSRAGFSDNPFVSPPLERLAEHGFVETEGDSTFFHAPDAHVLLSDVFLDQHCFYIQPDGGDRPELVGLAFEPVRDRDVGDVRGTIWLDRASGELRSVEYRYTGVSVPRSADIGGELEFERLPSGTWIVRRWNMRMPVFGISVNHDGLGRVRKRSELVAIAEEGGEVMEIRSAEAALARGGARAALRGSVFDSISGKPLAGATVALSGTAHSATTDEQGRFSMENLPTGRYAVSVLHPFLDATGVYPTPVEVALEPEQTGTVALATPSAEAVLARRCPDASLSDPGLVLGRVGEPGSDRPVAGAEVKLTWRGRTTVETRSTRTNAAGIYRFCNVPRDREIKIYAKSEGTTSRTVPFFLTTGAIGERNLALRGDVPADGAGALAQTADVVGRLIDASTGAPIGRATVQIEGTDHQQVTDAEGRFTMQGVGAGQHVLRVQHPGYGDRTAAATVQDGRAELELRLSGDVLALAPIVATSRARTRRAAETRAAGTRKDVFTRSEIDLRERSARNVGDVVRTIPGLRVRDIYYRNTRMIKEVCIESATRPTRLRDGGSVCSGVQIYVDDVLISNGGEFIRSFPLSNVESLEYIKSGAAGSRYGTGSANGVLLIYTRGNGPYAEQNESR